MTRPGTLLDLLVERAEATPNAAAYSFLRDGEGVEEQWTFRDLYGRAAAAASALAEIVRPGDHVLLGHSAPAAWLTGLFACVYRGAIAVPVASTAQPDDLERIARVIRPACALLEPELRARVAEAGPKHEALSKVACVAVERSAPGAAGIPPATRRPGDPAIVQFTSGSTGAPRGVVLTHENILANQHMIQRAFGHDARSTFVGWLPLFHDMGLFGNVVQPLFVGAHSVLMEPAAFLARPQRWLSAISRYRAHTSGGPNFGYALAAQRIRPDDLDGVDLSSWRIAFNGAEPVNADTLDRFAAAFQPFGFRRSAFYPCYGMAEATLFVSGGRPGQGAHVLGADVEALGQGRLTAAGSEPGRRLVSCGAPADGISLVVLDASGHEVPAGHVGEIHVAGPNVTEQILGDGGDDALVMRDGRPERYLRTRDLGVQLDGHLYVLGRTDDVIIVRGRNYHPHDLEETAAASHPALRAGCAAAFASTAGGEHEVVLLHEVRRELDEATRVAIAAAIRRAIAERHGVAVTVVLVPRGAIPRTTSGKVRRSACRAEYEQRTARRTGEPASRAAGVSVDWLRSAVAEILRVDEGSVPGDRSLGALGLDSLGVARLSHRVQDVFHVDLPLARYLAADSLATLAQELVRGDTGSPAEPLPTPDVHRLSQRQRAMWFFQEYAPDSAAYQVACAARLVTPIAPARISAAVAALLERHPTLRAVFRWHDGDVRLDGFCPADSVFATRSASGLSLDDLVREVERDAYRPSRLAEGPNFRITLWTDADRGDVLVLSAHHILVDLWSLAVLLDELGRLVTDDPAALPVAEPHLEAAFAAREAASIAAFERDGRDKAMLTRIQGAQPLELPAVVRDATARPYEADNLWFRVDRGTTERLRALAEELAVTPYTVLLTAYAVVLHRYCNVRQFLIGSPTWCRDAAELRRAVGCFVNTMVVRCDLSGDPSFAELVRRMFPAVLDGLRDAEYPHAVLVKRARAEGIDSHHIDAFFTLHQAPVLAGDALSAFALGVGNVQFDLGGLRLASLQLGRPEFDFPVALAIGELDDGLAGHFVTNRSRVGADMAARMADDLVHLLERIARDASTKVSSGEIISAGDRDVLLARWQPVPEPPAASRTLCELWDEHVARTPDGLAVVGKGRSLTYAEVDQIARRLATLLAERPDRGTVALLLPPGPEWVIAMIASLYARRAILPVDLADPLHRLSWLLNESGATTVATTAAHAPTLTALLERCPNLGSAALLDSEPPADLAARLRTFGTSTIAAASPHRAAAQLQDDVYVVYTSGSTGVPKGVSITHANLEHLIRWLRELYQIRPGSRLLESLSVCFDFGLEEVLTTVLCGGTLYAFPSEDRRDPDAYIDLVEQHAITMAYWTPSLCASLVARKRPMRSIEVILLGGEALDWSLVAALRALVSPTCRIFNGYGLTETAITSTMFEIGTAAATSTRTVPIGGPSSQTRLYVLNEHRALMPIGVPGELWVGGPSVAAGYRSRPDLTSARFHPDPFAADPGRLMYKTGDRVRWLPDGTLEFLGRFDHQVKVRGFRVEPDEVQSVLRRDPRARDAAVIAVATPGLGNALWAFLVLDRAEELDQVQRAVVAAVPSYMVPARWFVVAALPTTPNGKIDRDALVAIGRRDAGGLDRTASPRNQVEAEILRTWQEVLQVPSLSRDTNFFEAGGHSLLAVTAQRELEQRLGRKVSVSLLFERPTAALLAEALLAPPAAAESRHYNDGLSRAPQLRSGLRLMRHRLNRRSENNE